jgi:hypothetical protein
MQKKVISPDGERIFWSRAVSENSLMLELPGETKEEIIAAAVAALAKDGVVLLESAGGSSKLRKPDLDELGCRSGADGDVLEIGSLFGTDAVDGRYAVIGRINCGDKLYAKCSPRCLCVVAIEGNGDSSDVMACYLARNILRRLEKRRWLLQALLNAKTKEEMRQALIDDEAVVRHAY